MNRRLAAAALLALSLAGCAGNADGQGPTARATALIPVSVESANGRHVFQVEVARTAEQQQRGLMFRTELADDRGMLFPLGVARPASFWMRNVPIPLDIIFIRADGTIARIADAVPFSEQLIDSGEPVTAVLEIRNGRADELGIAPGDRVSWRDDAEAQEQ